MKGYVTVAVVASLMVIVAKPGRAQEGLIIPPMTREVSSRVSSGITTDWSRVQNLRPGSAVTVTIRDSRQRAWYFVGADDALLFVGATPGGDSVEAITRGDIIQVQVPLRRRGSKRGALIGTAVGTGASVMFAVPAVLMCREGPYPWSPSYGDNCALRKAVAFSFPVGGALLGYYAADNVKLGIIYRAP